MLIRNLSRELKRYICHCSACRLNQTPRHKPYGSLQLILTPQEPFHVIAIDFIVALPILVPEGYNSILTVTDKFSKRLGLIAGHNNYFAEDWVTRLLNHLSFTDWGLPRAIISDRYPQFLGNMWKEMCKRLGIKLLTTTAYHPQRDGQSEQSNQTIEICLRYYLITLEDDSKWPMILPALQSRLNNSRAATSRSSNEILYRFQIREALDMVLPATVKTSKSLEADRVSQRTRAKREAEEALAFIALESKKQFDRSHKPIFLELGQLAYL